MTLTAEARSAGRCLRDSRPVPRASGTGTIQARAAALILGVAVSLSGAVGADVPLPTPCLPCAGGPATFVTSGSATYVSSGTTGTVTQASERAILNWRNFNIAPGHLVEFRQPSTSAAALNRIYDASPSQIQGSLRANGQVLLVNRNGIVFGSGSRVDVRALTASALDISDQVFNDLGITGAINVGTNAAQALAAFEGAPATDAVVRVSSGSALHADERVVLIAPSVVNRGLIETPDGQTVLAASEDKVYVATSNELRGWLVEVGEGGSVENFGSIVAEQGNATLVGLAVNQAGRVRATTSVNVNGTVRLLARDGADPLQFVSDSSGLRQPVATRAGTATFTEQSITEVLPKSGTTESAIDEQVQPLSLIETMGRTIEVRSGAQLVAPGGSIQLTATSTPASPLTGTDATATVHVASGSRIDVAGDTSAVVPMERNQASIKLFGNELADAPLQRDGPLARQEITVDLRRGTELIDISRLQQDVRRTAAERLSVGGTLSIAAEGDVVLQPGSTVDVSGGQIRYEDGVLNTTRLITADGRIIDIADATPDQIYAGIFGDVEPVTTKWGIPSDPFVNGSGQFHAGYVEGKDAGSLSIGARNVLMSGTIRGDITVGPNQRAPAGDDDAAGFMRSADQLPLRGLLSVGRGGPEIPDLPSVLFGDAVDIRSIDFGESLPDDTALYVSLDQVVSGGINRIEARGRGLLLLPDQVSVELAPGGELSLSANEVRVEGDIRIVSGTVTAVAAQSASGPGRLELAADATIDLRGDWVNDAAALAGGASPVGGVFLDGGEVMLSSQGDLSLGAGSVVDVSAGAQVQADGSIRTGDAGAIRLSSVIPRQAAPTALDLDGQLRAYGFGTGGLVRLSAAQFRVGSPQRDEQTETAEVLLDPVFFGENGFSRFEFSSDRGGFVVDDGTQVALLASSLVLDPSYLGQPTGADLASFTQIALLPELERGPSSLSASVVRIARVPDESAVVRIGRDAGVTTGIGGSIELSSDAEIVVAGSLRAPSGDIRLTLRTPNSSNENGFRASQGIRLDEGSALDASGVASVLVNDRGQRSGAVYDGGLVTLLARRGYILTASGSNIDVSGDQAVLDLPGAPNGQLVATTVGSAAGDIEFSAAEGIQTGGTLRAAPGLPGLAGGSLRIALDSLSRDPNNVNANPGGGQIEFPTTARRLLIGSDPSHYFAFGEDVPSNLNGQALVPSRLLVGSGIDAIDLVALPTSEIGRFVPGEAVFNGAVELNLGRSISVDAPVIASIGQSARLVAPYVALGPTQTQYVLTLPQPADGSGRLEIRAGQIDLRGNIVASGFANSSDAAITLASQGDIRLIGVRNVNDASSGYPGSLQSNASLLLAAAQVYPATLTDYSISVTDPFGSVAIVGAGPLLVEPLSVGGRLAISANVIHHGGVVAAPFGEVSLIASERLELVTGGVISTSGPRLAVPFGQTEFGESWVYPLFGGRTLVLEETPEKYVSLDAPEVFAAPGAVVDIAGGGDLFAYEFVKGPGGSTDTLLGDNPDGSFAILPGAASLFGHFDPIESSAAQIATGSTIVLGEGGPVPAGEYARLPARYALIPGAYLLMPVEGFDGIQPGVTPSMVADQIPVLAGHDGYAGVDTSSTRWSGYAVLNNEQTLQRSQYLISRASDFFNPMAGLPEDDGAVSIFADRSLTLQGVLETGATAGRAAAIDIVAREMAVVTQRNATSERVELLDSELQNFGAASLLLGGSRIRNAADVEISVGAETVVIEEGANLSAAELMLAATDEIRVSDGATLSAEGESAEGDEPLSYRVSGDGALLALAARSETSLVREGVTAERGRLVVVGGAQLRSSGSVIFDSTGDMSVDGTAVADGSIEFSAARISLGMVPEGVAGLALSSEQLGRLAGAQMRLVSGSTIDMYGSPTLDYSAIQLDAAGLRGFGTADQAVRLHAGSIAIGNSTSAVLPEALGDSSGTLVVDTGELTLGPGSVDVSGFASVSVAAATLVQGLGRSSLAVHGDLTLATPLITAEAGADLSLSSDGALRTVATMSRSPVTAGSPLGARLQLTGASIDHGTRIELPSGIVSLRARNGSIDLREFASIDTSGRIVTIESQRAASPGGAVVLAAERGDVRLVSATSIVVSGADANAAGGGLTVEAPAGTFSIAGETRIVGAAEGADNGSFELSAARLEGGFSVLNAVLGAGGFGERLAVSLRQSGLVVGSTDVVKARTVELTASGGDLVIAGRIDATGPDGGVVRLNAGGDLAFEGDGVVNATASSADGRGGDVELISATGSIRFASAAAGSAPVIDVSGLDAANAIAPTGRVRLRAPRTGANDVAIDTLDAMISGAGRVEVEALRTYEAATVDDALLGAMRADTDEFMANSSLIENRLGVVGIEAFHLLPGIEVFSPGDLSVDTAVDLLDWRYDGEPGVLAIRAAGNLRIVQSLSDGVERRSVDEFIPERDMVGTGSSWSYRLVSGASPGSADPLQTDAGAGSLTIDAGAMVRTGTGSIDIASGGDLDLTAANSVIYTTGANRGTGALNPIDVELLMRGDFVRDGGNIRVAARGDVLGVTDRPLPDWLPRIAGEYFYNEGVVYPTAWAVNVERFAQGIGALGGGDVQVRSGGSLHSVTLVSATTGMPGSFDGSDLQVAGGGDVLVAAGGDVRGGVFFAGDGAIDVRAAGEINSSGGSVDLLPILVMSQASARLEGRRGVSIQTAFDPMVAQQDPRQGLPELAPLGESTYFFTYGDDSVVELSAIAGVARLGADGTAIAALYPNRFVDTRLLTIFPGRIAVRALSDDVVISGDILALPSPSGNLNLLANRHVDTEIFGQIVLSDADRSLLPSAADPVPFLNSVSVTNLLSRPAATPIHVNDVIPASVVAGTDVGSTGLSPLFVKLPKRARIEAGRDIVNLSLSAQNLDPTDATVLEAGRDIGYVLVRRPDGNLASSSGVIEVAGPGRLDFVAGGDVDLGTSIGVQTLGDLANAALQDSGADINVWAGIKSDPDFDAFIDRYIADGSTYAEALGIYMDVFPGDPSLTELENFEALPVADQRPFVQQVLFAELRNAGQNDIDTGFEAIQTLFPSNALFEGDLRSYLSRVTTIDGGNISIVVPGGLVNAGVASSGSIVRRPDQVGVVAQRDGSVYGFVQGDFLVNSSRVFALDGGDIQLWSSEGDIDAGRGPRAALVVPPPTVTFDAQGNVIIEYPPAISGSGIRTAVTTPGREPGDVYLFAPAGVVDAGDAGIVSAGNITVVATQVIGADNIVAGGVSVGVPVEGGLGASLAGASAASSSATSAAESVASSPDDTEQTEALGEEALSWLDVFVVGLGEEQCDPKDLECLRRQKKGE